MQVTIHTYMTHATMKNVSSCSNCYFSKAKLRNMKNKEKMKKDYDCVHKDGRIFNKYLINNNFLL